MADRPEPFVDVGGGRIKREGRREEDITYPATHEGGVYRAAIPDLRRRRIVGRSMSARRDATPVCTAHRTCWIGVSTAGGPIAPGSAISRLSDHVGQITLVRSCLSGLAKAGCIRRRFSIRRTLGSWAGQCPNVLTPTWSVRHCAARGGTANRPRACCHIPTERCSIPEAGSRI